eukprot:15352091-Ditylum_brightwellii.AAC.4
MFALNKAPTEYSTVLIYKQRQKGSALLMTDLQSAMTQLYCTMYGEKKGSNDKTPEVGLSSNDSKIKCYNCRGKGHKAFHCKEPKKKKNNRIKNKKCGCCGNKGHEEDNCWDDPDNVDKVPT